MRAGARPGHVGARGVPRVHRRTDPRAHVQAVSSHASSVRAVRRACGHLDTVNRVTEVMIPRGY